MRHKTSLDRGPISRRTVLATTAPRAHHKGPLVFMDYDQVELDASYDQVQYEPLIARVSKRLASNSEAMRARIGAPQRAASDRPRSRSWIFIAPAAPMRRSSSSFTAATGSR